MKTSFTLLFAPLSLAFTPFAMADDDLVCEGNVVYNGVSYWVQEDADSPAEARFELIEEACEDICRGLRGPSKKICEGTCERNADVAGQIHCRPNDKDKKHKKHHHNKDHWIAY